MSEFPEFQHNREDKSVQASKRPQGLRYSAELNNEQVEKLIELFVLCNIGDKDAISHKIREIEVFLMRPK